LEPRGIPTPARRSAIDRRKEAIAVRLVSYPSHLGKFIPLAAEVMIAGAVSSEFRGYEWGTSYTEVSAQDTD
jgi:hypothetical protein